MQPYYAAQYQPQTLESRHSLARNFACDVASSECSPTRNFLYVPAVSDGTHANVAFQWCIGVATLRKGLLQHWRLLEAGLEDPREVCSEYSACNSS